MTIYCPIVNTDEYTLKVGVVEETPKLKALMKIVHDTYSKFKRSPPTDATDDLIVFLQTTLVYFDESNQYGCALKQALPVGNYY